MALEYLIYFTEPSPLSVGLCTTQLLGFTETPFSGIKV